MKVKRIVPNIAAADAEAAKRFYGGILGLEIAMDMGWITTFQADASIRPQLSVAAQGGSGTAVPDLSIEVDDLDEALRRFQKTQIAIEYGPTMEPWGVRRFHVCDPFGRLPIYWSMRAETPMQHCCRCRDYFRYKPALPPKEPPQLPVRIVTG